MQPLIYTGGPLATHAYLIPNPAQTAYLCFDAPPGLAEDLAQSELRIEALLLTHGHSDHVADAAAMARAQRCPVFLHAADKPLFHRKQPHAGLELEELPVFDTAVDWSLGERTFTLFPIPGHTPGSVVFYERALGRLFGGDVLFAAGIGRCQTPELRRELLSGIAKWLLPLPDATEVYPGHGPSTLLGSERGEDYFRSVTLPALEQNP